MLKQDAESLFQKEGIADRCQYIEGNFFKSIPDKGDIYIFKAIFHGKTDQQAHQILKNLKFIMKPNSKAILVERVIAPGEFFSDGCLQDINMLNVTHGHLRTLDEFKILFMQNDFKINHFNDLDRAMKVIEISLS